MNLRTQSTTASVGVGNILLTVQNQRISNVAGKNIAFQVTQSIIS